MFGTLAKHTYVRLELNGLDIGARRKLDRDRVEIHETRHLIHGVGNRLPGF